MTNVTADPNVFDCLVLSGGGAKGAYEAGVAKALFAFYELKKNVPNLCIVGTSSGALNACVLAAYGPDPLIEFWMSLSNRDILSVRLSNPYLQFFFGLIPRGMKKLVSSQSIPPFSIYPNTGISQLIRDKTKFEDLEGKHVIITATDYTSGALKAFYISNLIDKFKAHDETYPMANRRLAHWERIVSDEILHLVLLASSAIPPYFPPVTIDGRWHIDGGVGNNTPTREAAYFFRYLIDLDLGMEREAYCVKLAPSRIIIEGQHASEINDILFRTYEVWQHVHMEPIVNAWYRINRETKEKTDNFETFDSWLKEQTLPGEEDTLPDEVTDQIIKKADTLFGRPDDKTKRLNIPLHLIQPTSSLGDTLDFNKMKIKENIELGYKDTLSCLRDKVKIDNSEYDNLTQKHIFEGLSYA